VFPRVLLSSDALKHNLTVVRRYAPQSRVMAVIKANGYGHGIVPVARALAAADAFAVARLNEAVSLREAGVTHRILLLEGVFSPAELEQAAAFNLDLVVHSFEQIAMLEAWRGAHRFAVWCKADTGMNRLGFPAADFVSAWDRLKRCTAVAPDMRGMTHFATADETDRPLAAAQVRYFSQLVAGLGAELSLANSAGLIGLPEARSDWVRPGIMLYGISPIAGKTAVDFDLRPAMTFESALIADNTVTVGAAHEVDWPSLGIGNVIRRNLRSGAPAVSPDYFAQLPSEADLKWAIGDLLEREINPAVAQHGGWVELIDVRRNNVYLRLGGGCQGCGAADVTLKQGIEKAIRGLAPAVGEILDTTDHAAGRNPFYAPSK